MPPSPRRAHTTCTWNNNIIVVGGGDGVRALADVHCLDLADPSRPVWSQLEPSGTPPIARGYHTSNLVKDKLIVYGGSDGHECFSDVFVLDLGNMDGMEHMAHTDRMIFFMHICISGQQMEPSRCRSCYTPFSSHCYSSRLLHICDWWAWWQQVL
jgi:hypothetical protein